MTTGDVVNKLWGFCHVLRHDGVDYGDYIEQLTYLLFIKMADERGAELPEHTDWPYLRKQSGSDLLDAYVEALRTPAKSAASSATSSPALRIVSPIRSTCRSSSA
jgi:type I restriction enzyme M protein